MIETGQDPRRFTEDLLRRLRDLVIVSAVPDAPATGLIDIAEDAAERLVAQAARFGPAELSRAADLVATGLTEMRGATAPRLLLELICARVLLPGADHSTEGVQARLDRLERRMTIAGGDTPPPPAERPVSPSRAGVEPRRPAARDAEPAAPAPVEPRPRRRAEPDPEPVAPPSPTPTGRAPAADGRAPARRSSGRDPEPPHAGRAADPTAPVTETAAGSPLSLVDVRRLWPDIVEATKQRRRVTWIHLTQHAQVVAVDAQVLTLGLRQRRRARLVRQRRQRRDRPAGRDRRRRPRLAGRDDRRPRRRGRRAPPPPAAASRAGHRPARAADAPTPSQPAERPRPSPRPWRPARRRPPAESPSATRPPGHRARRATVARDEPARRPARPTPTAAPAPTTTTPSPPGSTVPSCSSRRSAPRSSKRSPTSERRQVNP